MPWLETRPKSIFGGMEDTIVDDMIWDMNRSAYGGQPRPKVKARCPKCNERACPNAPYMQPPNRGLFYEATTFTIPVAQPKKRARRS